MNSSAKLRKGGYLASFFGGILTTIVSDFAIRLLTQPIILYSIHHQGGNVELVMKNHGFSSADRIKLELELINAVSPQPLIINDYAKVGESSSNYFTLRSDNRIVRFDDLGELGGFSSGKKFSVILKPLSSDNLRNYRNHDLKAIRHVGALSIQVDGVNTDMFLTAVFLSILIGFLLSIVLFLYLWHYFLRVFLRVR